MIWSGLDGKYYLCNCEGLGCFGVVVIIYSLQLFWLIAICPMYACFEIW